MSQNSDEIVPMLRCAECGHLVPERNMEMHQLRGCMARKRPSRPSVESDPMEVEEEERDPSHNPDFVVPSVIPIVNGTIVRQASPTNRAALPIAQRPFAEALSSSSPPPVAAAAPPTPPSTSETPYWNRLSHNLSTSFRNMTQNWTSPSRNNDDEDRKMPAYPALRDRTSSSSGILQVNDVVNLADDDDDVDDSEEDDDHDPGWTCPRCTLRNPYHSTSCDACAYSHNPQRPADVTRREQLFPHTHDMPPQSQQQPSYLNSPSLVSGGALVGSVLGAAGAYARGRNIASGAMEGAMTGAVGGAVLSDVFSAQQQQQQRRRRSSNQNNRASRQGPVTVRVVRHRNGGTTTYMTGNNNITSRARGREDAMMDQLLQRLMDHNMRAQGQNVDGMNYEQLLQMFGDGTENLNRGADDAQIHSLPTSAITDPHRHLTEDKRQCAICLDDYKAGDVRKTMPCLHGFHETCIDTWLRNNASCPICKHRLDNR